MGAREKTIEDALVKRVNELGGLCIKLTGYKGIPDRMCLLPGGEIYFIETKSSTGVLSESQKYWIQRLRALDFPAGRFDNLKDLNTWFSKEEYNE